MADQKELLAKYSRVSEDKSQLQQFAQDVINGEIGGGSGDDAVKVYEAEDINNLGDELLNKLKAGDSVRVVEHDPSYMNNNLYWIVDQIDMGHDNDSGTLYLHKLNQNPELILQFVMYHYNASSTPQWSLDLDPRFPIELTSEKHFYQVSLRITNVNVEDQNSYLEIITKFYESRLNLYDGLSSMLSGMLHQQIVIENSDDWNELVQTLPAETIIQFACFLGTCHSIYNVIFSLMDVYNPTAGDAEPKTCMVFPCGYLGYGKVLEEQGIEDLSTSIMAFVQSAIDLQFSGAIHEDGEFN